MVKYGEKLCPVYECVSLIGNYVNQKDSYARFQTYCANEEGEQLAMQLQKLSEEAGELIKERFPKELYLFRYICKERKIALLEQFVLSACDFGAETIEEQLHSMERRYEQEPALFLQGVISKAELEEDKELTEEELLELLQEEEFDDETKWQTFMMYKQPRMVLDTLKSMLQLVYPLYRRYETLWLQAMTMFQKERAQTYEEGGLYDHVCSSCNVYLKGTTVQVFPSIASCMQVIFLPFDKEVRVIYGIGTTLRLKKQETILSKEHMYTGLKLLGDESKFEILRCISHRPAYGAQLAKELKLSTPTISYHMQALLNAQFITCEKQNNRLYFQMNRTHMQRFLKQVLSELKLEE